MQEGKEEGEVMEIIYKPAANMTLADFSDQYGLSLLIEGLVASDDKYRASFVRGDELVIDRRGFGNTENEAVANLVYLISGQTIMYFGATMKVPPLVIGDIAVDVKKAIEAAIAKPITLPVKGI